MSVSGSILTMGSAVGFRTSPSGPLRRPVRSGRRSRTSYWPSRSSRRARSRSTGSSRRTSTPPPASRGTGSSARPPATRSPCCGWPARNTARYRSSRCPGCSIPIPPTTFGTSGGQFGQRPPDREIHGVGHLDGLRLGEVFGAGQVDLEPDLQPAPAADALHAGTDEGAVAGADGDREGAVLALRIPVPGRATVITGAPHGAVFPRI